VNFEGRLLTVNPCKNGKTRCVEPDAAALTAF
jgi:hypothetical protein